jgi:(S)-citramalyl-CoA lyase
VSQALVARSLLFVPATRPDRFAKAAASGTDIVTVDLEDSVAPRDKEAARQNVAAWLSAAHTGPAARTVRINSTRNLHGLRDILAIVEGQALPDLIVVPKVEAAADLEQLDALLQSGSSPPRLLAQIESARALAHLDEIAGSTPRLAALMLGSADLSADLRAVNSWESLLHARFLLVRAAAAAGLEVLDAPCFDLNDPAAVEEEARRSLRLGFTGKCAVHPKQVGPINATFSPSAEEVEHARAVLAENEKGVGLVDGQMIDEAIARRARRVLTLAEQLPVRAERDSAS